MMNPSDHTLQVQPNKNVRALPVRQMVGLCAVALVFAAILAVSLHTTAAGKTLFALLAGAGLAIAGTSYQGVFRNPMASPSLIGVVGAAYIGVIIATYLVDTIKIDTVGPREILAVAFGLGGVFLVLLLSRAAGRGVIFIEDLLLIGMMLASFYQAVNTFLASNVNTVTYLMTRMTGHSPTRSYALWDDINSAMNVALIPDVNLQSGIEKTLWYAVPICVCMMVLLLFRWHLTALSFGHEEAQAVGVNTEVSQMITVICSTVITAVVVADCGMIGWVGLIVPHICRVVVGADFKRVLPVSILAGGAFLMIINVLQVKWLWQVQNIGSICAMIGTPVFFYMLAAGRKAWS